MNGKLRILAENNNPIDAKIQMQRPDGEWVDVHGVVSLDMHMRPNRLIWADVEIELESAKVHGIEFDDVQYKLLDREKMELRTRIAELTDELEEARDVVGKILTAPAA